MLYVEVRSENDHTGGWDALQEDFTGLAEAVLHCVRFYGPDPEIRLTSEDIFGKTEFTLSERQLEVLVDAAKTLIEIERQVGEGEID